MKQTFSKKLKIKECELIIKSGSKQAFVDDADKIHPATDWTLRIGQPATL